MDVRYAPVWSYCGRLALWTIFNRPKGARLRHLTTVNTCFEHSGLFGVSKLEIARLLDKNGVPQPPYIIRGPVAGADDVAAARGLLAIGSPVFAKPEYGGRSRGILLFWDEEALDRFVTQPTAVSYVLQASVKGREYSAALERDEGGVLRAASVVERQRLSVVGDGVSTLAALATPILEPRQAARAAGIHGPSWLEVVPAGERRLVTLLGIHSLGARFVPADPADHAFADLARRLDGVRGLNYCRVDLIVSEDGQDYWVLEINGANAEPLEAYEEPIDEERFYGAFRTAILRRLEMGAVNGGGRVPSRIAVTGAAIRGLRRYLSS